MTYRVGDVAKHGDVYVKGPCELRCGDYREVLGDVEPSCVISDPPYGERTHNGQRHGRMDPRYGVQDGSHLLSSRGLTYDTWDADAVVGFVARWGGVDGWICVFHSHDQRTDYEVALQGTGRYVFAPLACVQHAMNVRLAGDGPSNWTTWLTVSRPRSMRAWGALPGAYAGASHDRGECALDRSKRAVAGAKPLWLMQAIVRDYSRHGDLVADPCAGGGTTLIAAAMEGRRAIGAELDPETFAKACARIERTALTAPLPFCEASRMTQEGWDL